MLNRIARLTAVLMLSAGQAASANTVSDWVEFANRIHSPLDPAPEGRARPESSRATTRVALAMFEALNAIDRRYESYVGIPLADKTASPDAAAITAAYQIGRAHV